MNPRGIRVRAIVEGSTAPPATARTLGAALDAAEPVSIDRFSARFGLSRFDEDRLLLAPRVQVEAAARVAVAAALREEGRQCVHS